jgi:hypothetical protein
MVMMRHVLRLHRKAGLGQQKGAVRFTAGA